MRAKYLCNTFKKSLSGMLLYLFITLSLSAQLPKEFNEEVTVITSDKLVYDFKNKFALFEGNVVVEDISFRLTSDKLHVIFNEAGDVKFIKATGQVYIQQDEKNARSEQATYDLVSGEIVLTGEPQLQRGRNLLFAELIKFWRDGERLESEGKSRLIVFPDEDGAGAGSLLGN